MTPAEIQAIAHRDPCPNSLPGLDGSHMWVMDGTCALCKKCRLFKLSPDGVATRLEWGVRNADADI